MTGIAAALIAAGRQVAEAAEMAAKVNRLAGFYANPNPGTPVRKIIECVPRALEEIIKITKEAGNMS